MPLCLLLPEYQLFVIFTLHLVYRCLQIAHRNLLDSFRVNNSTKLTVLYNSDVLKFSMTRFIAQRHGYHVS